MIKEYISVVGLLFLCNAVSAQFDPASIAAFLNAHHTQIGVAAGDSAGFNITDQYETQHLGITHVYLQQKHQDIGLYNGILNLNIRNGRLVSFGNRWIRDLQSRAPSNVPTVPARSAFQRAALNLGVTVPEPIETRREQNSLGQDVRVVFDPGDISRNEIGVDLMWVATEGNEVLLCWNVEIYEVGAENFWSIMIDAHSGAMIRKENRIIECAFDNTAGLQVRRRSVSSVLSPSEPSMIIANSYNVFNMPVESPNHGDRTIVVSPWDSAGMGNPATTLGWHDDGTTMYTITRGNNVYAYEDADGNNAPGFSPDNANLEFDYPFDPLLDPEEFQAAAITNLFFWNNLVHDVLYQYGFDEVSGNFQNDNLGRGGQGGDYVLAEAQDGGGLNNANFFTPADGSLPRMQMFLWSPVPLTSPFSVNSPPSIAGTYFAYESDFSTANKLADVGPRTGDLVLVNDSGAETHEACTPLSNGGELAGKIALIDRGNCNFTDKVSRVQDLGAIAAVVVNNEEGSPIIMGGSDNTITIPAVMISLSDGDLIKTVMDTETVNVTLDTVPLITPDGDFDNGIITHEYGHGISNRLTGGPSNVNCLINDEQMGEGWSDYFALMLTTDWSTAMATDRRGIGTYVLGEPVDGTGIRTYPYTPDTTVNPFTYADIADAPVNMGTVSPHYIGSVWATMLWDMTWSIIDVAGTDPDMYHGTGGNNIALQLVMDGLKLQPCSPGFVDGRDAILLADELRYSGQYRCAIWEAFAGRGLGVGADQGSTSNHQDGVESFDVPGDISVESEAAVADATEGEEVEFHVKVICGCEDKTDLVVEDVLSDDLIYIPGSGGTPNGNAVVFSADSLHAGDSLVFSYRAYIAACSATDTALLSEDDAEGPDQYSSVKLAGMGNIKWVTSTAQSVSPAHSWYAQDYSQLADIALTLDAPVATSGPVEIVFQHRYETEANFDGGVIEFSLDGGTSWTDAGPYFTQNGYPASITTVNTDSPILGQPAFTGNSDAQFDTTGFIQSRIQLCTPEGSSLRLRFRFVCDGGVGGSGINGWYVDDIVISQLSGLANKPRVTASGSPLDSQAYCLTTGFFEGDLIYVDQSAPAGSHGGGSWSEAIHYLPIALGLAGCRDADTVLIAEGTYLPTPGDDRQVSFTIGDSTSVFGAFPAGGGGFASRDPEVYVTTLTGDIGTGSDLSDNAYHVLKVSPGQTGLLLDGVTLSHGNANGAADDSMGAAVFNEGELILRNVTMQLNQGAADGQVILNRGAAASLHLDNCTVQPPLNGFVPLVNTGSGQMTIQGGTGIQNE